MTRMPLAYILVILSTFSAHLTAADAPVFDKDLHVFLLIGQSNMAGRGKVDSESLAINPRILVLTKELAWKSATDPLHFDKPAAGVGPGLAFAKQIVGAQSNIRVGLVPCAVGGTSISAWSPGELDKETNTHPYDDMLKRALVATKYGALRGILWHQGESDRGKMSDYGDRLMSLVARVRQDLQSPTAPFIAGEISGFRPETVDGTTRFNAELNALPARIPLFSVVSANGLQHKGDRIHYDTDSARILGVRYADIILQSYK